MLRAAFVQGATAWPPTSRVTACSRGDSSRRRRAKTLLLYGSRDPLAGPRHGRWWNERLPDARLEVAPGAGHLLVIPMWARVLSHLAPQRRRLQLVSGSGDEAGDGEIEEFSAA